MKTITLNILAEDFKETSFFNSSDCVITRAIKRLNNSKLTPSAIVLYHNDDINEGVQYPQDLLNKVISMYGQGDEPLKPQDFTYSLEVPDNW